MAENRAFRRDATIDEKVNAGLWDLMELIPDDIPGADSYTTMFLVGRRRRDMNGEETGNPHAQHRGDAPHGASIGSDPSFVIYSAIPGWEYSAMDFSGLEHIPAGTNPVSKPKARVFRVEGQRMTLDIAQTVSFMRPCLVDYEAIEIVIKALESEADFDNVANQRVLQGMYERVSTSTEQKPKPMIPGFSCVPYSGNVYDPRKIYLPQMKIVLASENPLDAAGNGAQNHLQGQGPNSASQ